MNAKVKIGRYQMLDQQNTIGSCHFITRSHSALSGQGAGKPRGLIILAVTSNQKALDRQNVLMHWQFSPRHSRHNEWRDGACRCRLSLFPFAFPPPALESFCILWHSRQHLWTYKPRNLNNNSTAKQKTKKSQGTWKSNRKQRGQRVQALGPRSQNRPSKQTMGGTHAPQTHKSVSVLSSFKKTPNPGENWQQTATLMPETSRLRDERLDQLKKQILWRNDLPTCKGRGLAGWPIKALDNDGCGGDDDAFADDMKTLTSLMWDGTFQPWCWCCWHCWCWCSSCWWRSRYHSLALSFLLMLLLIAIALRFTWMSTWLATSVLSTMLSVCAWWQQWWWSYRRCEHSSTWFVLHVFAKIPERSLRAGAGKSNKNYHP